VAESSGQPILELANGWIRTTGYPLVGVEERTAIETALEALRRAREGSDRDLIREATTALNRATEHLAEVMMDAALKGALASRRADEIMDR